MNRAILVAEAYIRLIEYDLFLSNHNLGALHRRLLGLPVRSKRSADQIGNAVVRALGIACALYPKQILCLKRSTVLVAMLRSRGVNARMVIGVQRLPFKAHAWVEVDGAILDDRLAARERFLQVEQC